MADFDVRSSFVSFVDHLPSDIVRKLWLIQSLDITYDALVEQLNSHLKHLQTLDKNTEEYKKTILLVVKTSNKLHQIRTESLEESKSISATIKLARLKLENQHQQLQHDYSIYQNSIEVRNTLSKHSQRTNKRTNNRKLLQPPPPKLNTRLDTKIRISAASIIAKHKTKSLKVSKPSRLKGTKKELHAPSPRGRPPKVKLLIQSQTKSNSKSESTPSTPKRKGRPPKVIETPKSTPKATPKSTSKSTPKSASKATPKSISKRTKKSTPKKKSKGKELVIPEVITRPKALYDPEDPESEEDETKLYCICKRPSFGDMVGCDNPKCKREWFHYACVNLTRPPRGTWLCPPCTKKKLKREEKERLKSM